MKERTRMAWRDDVSRVHVHTCTLDHPAALAAYARAGFVPYKRAIERFPDPRLLGFLPSDCAPHPFGAAERPRVRDAARSRTAGRRRRRRATCCDPRVRIQRPCAQASTPLHEPLAFAALYRLRARFRPTIVHTPGGSGNLGHGCSGGNRTVGHANPRRHVRPCRGIFR